MSTKIFNIVSHFKFEVGSAITNTGKIQSSLDKVSKTADRINNQFKGLAVSNALSITGGGGGIVSILHKMVDASEKRYKTELKLAAILRMNSKSMAQSIKDIDQGRKIGAKTIASLFQTSQKYGLPVDSMVGEFSRLLPLFLPKGAAGKKDFDQTKKLVTNLLRAPELMGVEPWVARAGLTGMLEGRMEPGGNVLFRRLAGETETLKPYQGIAGARKWERLAMKNQGQNLPVVVKMVNKAFEEFFKDKKLTAAQLKTVSAQMNKLNNHFSAFSKILVPIGDVLRNRIVTSLMKINEWIGTHLTKTLKGFAPVIKFLISDFKELYIQLKKLSTLGGDFSKAKGKAFGLYVLFETVRFMKNVNFAPVKKMATFISVTLPTAILTFLKKMGAWKILKFLFKSVTHYMAWLLPLTILTRAISSARAQAKANDMENFAKGFTKLSSSFTDGVKIIAKISAMASSIIDPLGKALSFLFQYTWWIQRIGKISKYIELNKGLDNMITLFVGGMFDIIHALNYAIKAARLFSDSFPKMLGKAISVFSPATGAALSLLGMGKNGEFKNFSELIKDYQKTREKALGNMLLDKQIGIGAEIEKAQKAETVINVGTVNIRNNFKENYEPDRIAIAIKDVFLKAAQARTSSDLRINNQIPGLETE